MGSSEPNDNPTKIPDILIDAILDDIRRTMQSLGQSPQLVLPPSESPFSEKIWGFTGHGKLKLTNGKLTGHDTLHRVRESTLRVSKYAHNTSTAATKRIVEVTFTVDIGLTDLTMASDFHLILNSREMNGMATGKLTDIVLTITIALNVLTRRMRLKDWKFSHLGHVSTEITGLGMFLGFVVSKIANTMLNKDKLDMATAFEKNMKETLSKSEYLGLVDNIKWPGTQRELNLIIEGLQSASEENGADGGDESGEAEAKAGSSKK